MRQFLKYLIVIVISLLCSTVSETSKQQTDTGIYNVRNYKNKAYYLDVREDSIMLIALMKKKAGWIADTSKDSAIALNTSNPRHRHQTWFLTRSFDLDVLSIVFKYRPYTPGFPNQLKINFNAAEFIGHVLFYTCFHR